MYILINKYILSLFSIFLYSKYFKRNRTENLENNQHFYKIYLYLSLLNNEKNTEHKILWKLNNKNNK